MTSFGRILRFDQLSGRGEIAPDLGATAISFTRDAMQPAGTVPRVDHRYEYDQVNNADGAKVAINIRAVSAVVLSLKEQAELHGW